jgi:hypothetical protein
MIGFNDLPASAHGAAVDVDLYAAGGGWAGAAQALLAMLDGKRGC